MRGIVTCRHTAYLDAEGQRKPELLQMHQGDEVLVLDENASKDEDGLTIFRVKIVGHRSLNDIGRVVWSHPQFTTLAKRFGEEQWTFSDYGTVTRAATFWGDEERFKQGMVLGRLAPGTELLLRAEPDTGFSFIQVQVLHTPPGNGKNVVATVGWVKLSVTSFAERFKKQKRKKTIDRECKLVPMTLLPGEADLLAAVVADLNDDGPKLVYADWLEDHGDPRAAFLRDYVQECKRMPKSHPDLPEPQRMPEEWLELIGFRLMEKMVETGLYEKGREAVLRVARPALRMKTGPARDLAIGASKIGGFPELPEGFRWPPGGDCNAIYNEGTGGTDRLAGFMAQVNFAEIAHTQGARDLLPEKGVLSFFCFQDMENDNPDAIGALALFFPDPARLVPTKPPKKLTEGNKTMKVRRLMLKETLDLPENDGPWSEDVTHMGNHYHEMFGDLRKMNFENVLGYGRSTTGGDPTPSKKSRHLILLENAAGCKLHIQIDAKDLAARKFDKITLNWVDFD